ncbi:hypothetical protein BO70DRAFT_365878 [Aspergillus heteromorphus CBS 117.55]|uniref:Uncharacterized protein n=1 Tax=Aspergillus heteromorphus CBS 117.55 TaxID=1448321 RepID=A0A317V4Z1_9EURO|nr:uncharacterized protein BO70DRAFT_365878 [Aspergillus heteromorphus CBS 117.55]PWY69056.1 hypothetical protein BO70DRAFT_365878 [Aspergillus heteromorphus CBS 117.55]
MAPIPDTEVTGWVDGPNDRGTIDIIWGCCLVLSTALWTVLHLNIPGSDDTTMTVLWRKIRWGTFAILAPDMLVGFSAMQWQSAQESVTQMHSLGYKEWTLKHAFYANSGGFLLRSTDYPPFPVTATSIHYLLETEHIDCPTITADEIWDKSKADTFAKCVALVQGVWLVVQSIARAVEGLAVSPLELFTIAFVLSTITTYYFWMNKPQNVGVPTFIDLKTGSVNNLVNSAGHFNLEPFRETPLDFVEKPMQRWQRRPTLEQFRPQDQPLRRMPDDKIVFNGLCQSAWALVCFQAMVHPALHLLCWNHVFPTKTEQTLWRVMSVFLASGLPLSSGLRILLTACGFHGHQSLTWIWVQPGSKEERGWREWVLDVIMSFISACLVPARLYIIIEAFISLRRLPASSYVTVEWTNFIPHV